MDVRINEVQTRVRSLDSQALLDPKIMREIVKACVRAVKEEQAREKRARDERTLTSGIPAAEH